MSTPFPILPDRAKLSTFGFNFPSWSNTTPFTYQDGMTNVKMLESLIQYIDKTLVPYVNDETADLVKAWSDNVLEIITKVDDAVDDVIGNSIELQDVVAGELASDPESRLRQVIDVLFSLFIVEDPENPGLYVMNVPGSVDGAIAFPDWLSELVSSAVTGDIVDAVIASPGLSVTIAQGAMSAVYQDFTGAADGPLTETDTGQDWFLATGGGADAAMRIVGGRMTNAATAAGTTKAGHATVRDLPSPIARMGGVFEFTAGAGNGGTATMVAWATPIIYPGPVPDSATHITISVLGWELIRFTGGVGTQIAAGVFKTSLTPLTAYTVEWAVLGDTLFLTLPDGTTTVIKHPDIATKGRAVPDWETYQADASTNHRARWLRIWADHEASAVDARFASVPRARAIAVDAAKDAATVARTWPSLAQGDQGNVTIPSAEAEISTDLRVPFVAPPSGKVVIRASAQVYVQTAGGDVRWTFVIAAVPLTFSRLIAKSVADERYLHSGEMLLDGLIPGNRYEVVWRHRAVSPAVAYLRANPGSGSQATISVTPVV